MVKGVCSVWVLEADTESNDHYIVAVFKKEPTTKRQIHVLKAFFKDTDEVVIGTLRKMQTVYSKLTAVTLEEK